METKEITTTKAAPPTLKQLLSSENIQNRFKEILGQKAAGFISSVLNVVNGSTNLSKADPNSVIMSAAVAATLDLPINSNLGFAHIVPYAKSWKDGNGQWQSAQLAQFQMGWKGFVQLAMRTGQYKTMGASPILGGQLIGGDPLKGFEFDFSKATANNEVIGYAAYFRLLNGFEKTVYWNVGKVVGHAQKYSKSFENANGQWKTNFEAMALKTVVKNILSQWGILSIDMQRAIQLDQAVIKNAEGTEFEYIDSKDHDGESGTQNAEVVSSTPHESPAASLSKTVTADQL